MFNPIVAKTQLIDALNKIEFGRLELRARPDSLQLRADGIQEACALFAAFIEEMAEDADASISSGRINGIEARNIIKDVGSDVAGQIMDAADRIAEMA